MIAECGVCGSPVRRVKNRGCPSYACAGEGDRSIGRLCVARSQKWVDDLVTEIVLEKLERPDALAAFATGDDGKAAGAAVEAQALREQLDSYIAAAATLSPATLAKVEARQSVQVTLR